MIIIVLVILIFMGLCLYSIIMPKVMVHRGRQVDVRVISCEPKTIQLGDQTGSYYEVTVDFYGLNGETIHKTFQSEEYYEEGSVIRSRYIDETGHFLVDADNDAKNKNQRGIWLVILFLVVMLAIIFSSIMLQDAEGNLPDWYTMGFGYIICFLFMGVGVWGFVKRRHLSKNKHNMQVIPGYVVDVITEQCDDSELYHPIYEYELMGMKYRYESRLSSNSIKRCKIGRKVHMLRNCETGEIACKEDEQSGNRLTLIFGIVGAVVFLLLLGNSTGVLQNYNTGDSSEEETRREETSRVDEETSEGMSALQVYVMYPEGTEKCSYSVEISEDGKGEMLLFPTTAISGKGIDQQISFDISTFDVLKISGWVSEADIFSLSMADVAEDEIFITVYVIEGEERAGGRGGSDEAPYKEMYELLQNIVPDDVWDEMAEREAEYYSE